ncbi:MAG: VOC family protein [Patescibacteria group bacterium UBA2103]
MHTLEHFYKDAEELISVFDAFVEQSNVKDMALPDHICFKCGDTETFENIRSLLEKDAAFLHQANISGRRIAMVKLTKPFVTSLGEITVLELSDQKQNNSQTTTFDHIEIYPKDISFDVLVKKIEASGAPLRKVERPHHTTYDIQIGDTYNVKLTEEPIFEKIKRDEM